MKNMISNGKSEKKVSLRSVWSLLLVLSLVLLTGCAGTSGRGDTQSGFSDLTDELQAEFDGYIPEDSYTDGTLPEIDPAQTAGETGEGADAAASDPMSAFATESASIEEIMESLQVDLSTVRLGGLKDSTSMGLAGLLDQCGEFTMAGTEDEIATKLLNGELDIAAVSINQASVLYNKSEEKIRMIAVSTLGVNYIVENPAVSAADSNAPGTAADSNAPGTAADSNAPDTAADSNVSDSSAALIQSISDLKGRTIYATGKGATPEYILTYLLKKNGLDISKDVDMQWKSEPSEVISIMASRPGCVAVLPQPYVTEAEGQVENLRTALDLTAEWDAQGNGSRLVSSVLVATADFADQHSDLVDDFLAAYEASSNFVNTRITDASQMIEECGIVKASVAEKAISQCSIVCITGAGMKIAAEGYLGILYGFDPQSVGGMLPGLDFYYGAQ